MTSARTRKMLLASNIQQALAFKRAGTWRANGYAAKIHGGKVRLSNLRALAKQAGCSLVYLTSGGMKEEDAPMDVKDAICKSIEHGGYDKHDFARMMGYASFAYIANMIDKGTIPVRVLIKFAKTLNIYVWELLCDGECHDSEIVEYEPTPWDQLVELNLMGWLDTKRRDEYEKEEGPGI